MLSTTRALIELCERGDASWRERDLHASVVLRHGSRADAEALLPVFLAAPERNEALVAILAAHGDVSMARQLEAACVGPGGLREGVPGEVLHCLGYLGHESAQGVLWEYARDAGDWSMQRSACRGLLHLPCLGLEADISRELARHEGQNLFPEFLPVLAHKTGEPAWLQRLVEWGEKSASTDCNGGLILGVALYGEAGRPHFERLLWSERWEAHGGGTGSDAATYAGARVLGLSLPELYKTLRRQLAGSLSTSGRQYAVHVFCALLELWIERPWLGLRMASDPTESYAELHALLFRWSTPHQDDSLTGLAREGSSKESGLVPKLHRMEREILLRMRHDLELSIWRDG